jgi:hypothetical protein
VELTPDSDERVEIPLDGETTIRVVGAADEPLASRTADCDGDDTPAVVAASLIVVTLLASAAGVVPWPGRGALRLG